MKIKTFKDFMQDDKKKKDVKPTTDNGVADEKEIVFQNISNQMTLAARNSNEN